jgi:RNA polymerase sigma-70 factor (ECF subfamily)
MMPDEEDLWIERARRGDVESFSRVVLLRQGYVRAFLGRFTGHPDVVDDLAQETFLRAFMNLETFDGRAPFLAWVAGIARNLALEHLRKEFRRLARQNARLADAMAAWRAQGSDSEATTPEGHERYVRAVQGCLGHLPPKSADVVTRHYFSGEPAASLAQRLKTSVNAVHQLLFRVRQALRRCVEKRLAEET